MIFIELFLEFEKVPWVNLQGNQSWLEKGTKEHLKNVSHFLYSYTVLQYTHH